MISKVAGIMILTNSSLCFPLLYLNDISIPDMLSKKVYKNIEVKLFPYQSDNFSNTKIIVSNNLCVLL